MNEKRILKLVEFMEALPKSAEQHFDMSSYVAHSGDHEHELPKRPKDLHACGTTACALGWMATMPTFRRLGLSIGVCGGELWPHMGERAVDYDEVGLELLGLNWLQSKELFGGENSDKTPKEWARRVRGLMKRWKRAEQD